MSPVVFFFFITDRILSVLKCAVSLALRRLKSYVSTDSHAKAKDSPSLKKRPLKLITDYITFTSSRGSGCLPYFWAWSGLQWNEKDCSSRSLGDASHCYDSYTAVCGSGSAAAGYFWLLAS